MNREQQKYLIKRIDDEARKKINAIDAECTPKPFYNNSRCAVILENKLPLSCTVEQIYEKLRNNHNCYVVNLFDLSAYEPNKEANDQHYKKRCAALHARVAELKDSIMFGDAKEALEIFAKFAKEEF